MTKHEYCSFFVEFLWYTAKQQLLYGGKLGRQNAAPTKNTCDIAVGAAFCRPQILLFHIEGGNT